MHGHHIAIGIALLVLTVAFLAATYVRAPRRRPLARLGWLGLAVIVSAEVLLFLRTPGVIVFFTPIAWTGYLLLIRALVECLGGESRLLSLRKTLTLGFWSVPLWLIFEAYNLRLKNWTYVGLPLNPIVADLGYVWSFATIWPAIFGTADFLRALGLFRRRSRVRHEWEAPARTATLLAGVVLVVLPVLLPARIGSYLFAFVWVGFIPLLEPLNYQWGGHSVVRDAGRGDVSTFWSFFAAGWVCGILWEFWNYWAAAKWLYVFPILQNWKIFEMPIPGYLGFLPFAVECFVMYEFLIVVKSRARWV